jgi:hypothetical protein
MKLEQYLSLLTAINSELAVTLQELNLAILNNNPLSGVFDSHKGCLDRLTSDKGSLQPFTTQVLFSKQYILRNNRTTLKTLYKNNASYDDAITQVGQYIIPT